MPPKSAGLPQRRERDARQDVVAEFGIGEFVRRHFGFDPAGQDRIGRDAVARQFDRHGADHGDDAALGRRVILVPRSTRERGQARRGDEPAAFIAVLGALDHVLGGGAQSPERAIEIDRQRLAPFGLAQRQHALVLAPPHPGIGKARIDAAQAAHGFGHRRLDRRALGHVAKQRFHLAAMGCKPGAGRVVLRLARAPDTERRARHRERFGHAETDAAISARDHGDLAGEIESFVHGASHVCALRGTLWGRPFKAAMRRRDFTRWHRAG